ncbi:hypothetical protein KAJ83_17670 [Marivibrio halodurans]|uniref:Uncharacterized protein n=1 Tax=Marivibrio halodurans TaxID=2039722 RepID=A0A8J7V498_9PROT|nr:hypothetical protein [Marivibrio halodurans]MBP5858852.1 hypothetical protein [Marivibrio halodurans]
MRLPLRIAIMLLLVLGFGVGLTAFLSQAKFERTLEDLVRSRLQVVALDLSHTMEGALGLGLSLEEARNIPDALATAAAADSDILWIGVRDQTNSVLFETGTPPPEEQGLSVTAPIVNAFDQPAGRVTVVGSRAAVGQVVADSLRRLGLVSAIAVLAATLVGALLASLALRGIVHRFAEARDALRAMRNGRTPEIPPPDADATPLDRDFIAFRRLARQAFVDLHHAEREANGSAPPRAKG